MQDDDDDTTTHKMREVLAAYLGRYLGNVPDAVIRAAYAKYAEGVAQTYLDVSKTLHV